MDLLIVHVFLSPFYYLIFSTNINKMPKKEYTLAKEKSMDQAKTPEEAFEIIRKTERGL
ncbi:hypothetical protein ANBU17_27790 [Anaerostipes butyraticus]|uniref:Uncharacterized protein n=2 Tax=Anaerostipes butyraticus TaxID=645466 RepID=A0A916Q8Y5_9FIRM|nr:hypothetical protein ANBU17_27790 [Anaerostipes butyraticus]